jgi:hypothetical protein
MSYKIVFPIGLIIILVFYLIIMFSYGNEAITVWIAGIFILIYLWFKDIQITIERED